MNLGQFFISETNSMFDYCAIILFSPVFSVFYICYTPEEIEMAQYDHNIIYGSSELWVIPMEAIPYRGIIPIELMA